MKQRILRIAAIFLLIVAVYVGFMTYRYYTLDSRTYQACLQHVGDAKSDSDENRERYCGCIGKNYARFSRYQDAVLAPLLPERTVKKTRTQAMIMTTDACREPGRVS